MGKFWEVIEYEGQAVLVCNITQNSMDINKMKQITTTATTDDMHESTAGYAQIHKLMYALRRGNSQMETVNGTDIYV